MKRDPAESLEQPPALRLRPFSLESRPPFLGPMRRELDAETVARFRGRLVAALALESSARIEVTEWVSFDCRDVPHTTMVAISTDRSELAFSIEKPLEKVEVQDVLARWRPRVDEGRGRRPVVPSSGRSGGAPLSGDRWVESAARQVLNRDPS